MNNTFDQNGGDSSPYFQNSLERLANENGLQEAIAKTNYENSSGRPPEDYQGQILGYDPETAMLPEHLEDDDYTNFLDEPPEEIKKPKKKFNDAKKRIDKKEAERKAALEQAAQDRLRADNLERELKRVNDERDFVLAHQQKTELDLKAYEASQRWTEAHETGDTQALIQANLDMQEAARLSGEKTKEISSIAQKYERYQTEVEQENSDVEELRSKQYEAYLEFSDSRELESPLYEGFILHHDYLNPFDEKYNARIAEKVEPIKFDLIEELTINGQADVIGTKDYFTELSSRIYRNLNSRSQQQKGHNTMAYENDPRYQEPDYKQIQEQMQQNYAPPQYQQPQYQNQQPQYAPPQYQQPQRQQNYAPPQYQQNQQYHQSVAPVNRQGYNNTYGGNPNNVELDSTQREILNDLFMPALDNLSQKINGRPMSYSDAEESYKRSWMNPRKD